MVLRSKIGVLWGSGAPAFPSLKIPLNLLSFDVYLLKKMSHDWGCARARACMCVCVFRSGSQFTPSDQQKSESSTDRHLVEGIRESRGPTGSTQVSGGEDTATDLEALTPLDPPQTNKQKILSFVEEQHTKNTSPSERGSFDVFQCCVNCLQIKGHEICIVTGARIVV